MTPDDLAAIRARDAACRNGNAHPPQSFWSCAADRRALLAEVDRLRAYVPATLDVLSDDAAMALARDAERARSLPVIEAARELYEVDHLSGFRCGDPQHDALRDALAAYEGEEP